MSFFGPSYFKSTLAKRADTPKRSKQIPDNQKPKPPHEHRCQECQYSFRCNMAFCNLSDSVLKCYHCQGSNFQTYRV